MVDDKSRGKSGQIIADEISLHSANRMLVSHPLCSVVPDIQQICMLCQLFCDRGVCEVGLCVGMLADSNVNVREFLY